MFRRLRSLLGAKTDAGLSGRVSVLEKELRARTNEVHKLKYQATLTNRTFETLFGSVFGRSLTEFVGKHEGERCFIVGNGPSLNKIDMKLLKDEITLGSNRAFVGFKDWGFAYNYWMVQDRILAEQSADDFAQNLPGEVVKFIPYTILKFFKFGRMDNVVPVHLDYTQQCTFSHDPTALHEGFTVTTGLLQIAAIMGFKKIILVGVDHNYVIPKKSVNEDSKWSGAGLSNHFSDEYTNHQQGQVWEMPDIEKMTKAYDSAAAWAVENGIEIVNATPGTKLKSFPTTDYNTLFPKP